MSKTIKNAFVISFFILFLCEYHHLSFTEFMWLGGRRSFIIFYLAPLFLLARGKLWSKNIVGRKLFGLYLFFALLNIATCYYFRGQKPDVSLIAWTPLFFVFYYFTFRTWEKGILVWENVIEIQYIIILSLFALKYMFLDWEFLKLDTVEDYLNQETRVRIYSDAFLELGYLYSFNKFLVTKNHIKYGVLSFLGISFIFLQGFRMMLAMGIVVSFILILKSYKITLRSILLSAIISLLAIVAVSQVTYFQDKIAEMTNRNETQNFDNSDYIRLTDINFTYTQFFLNQTEMVLGAGRTPFGNNSKSKNNFVALSEYSKERTRLATQYGYYPVDLGLLGLSWEAGIPFTLVIILVFLYLWRVKVDKRYYYISCYGLYMVIIGLTHPQGYYHSNLICLAVCYTIAEMAKMKFTTYSQNYMNTKR